MFADSETLAWINAIAPLIMAGAGVLWAIAAWINRKATAEAVVKAGKETVAAVVESSDAAADRADAAAEAVKDVKIALKDAVDTHAEKLDSIEQKVNGNTDKMLATMKDQHEEIVKLVGDNATLTADAKSVNKP